MKVLILGSKGFIGKHLVKYLSGFHEVFKADIDTSHGEKNYFQIDVVNYNYLEIFGNSFDFCINCTGAANVGASIQDPKKDFYLNSVNVFSILDAIRQKSPNCYFVNLSSAAVYGQPNSNPISETHDRHPLSPYGIHKKISEDLMKEFFDIYSISGAILRIFSCYGPGLKKQLFWDAYQKFENNIVSFFGTGEETRDFIYIDDLVKAIRLILENRKDGIETYNVASGIETKISDALEIYAKEYGLNQKVLFTGNKDAGQPSNWKADISKLKALGFEASTPMKVGLARYISWIKNE